jgi:hypothetical protein
LSVYDCHKGPGVPQHTFWILDRAAESGERDWATRIAYGVVPEGYKSERGPDLLTPGCYEASVTGTGFVSFVIDSGGAVTERPGSKFVRRLDAESTKP